MSRIYRIDSELSGEEEAASFSNELHISAKHLTSKAHSRFSSALSSDWSVNSFIMVVYEKYLYKFSQNFMSKAHQKKFSQTTFIKLFTDQ